MLELIVAVDKNWGYSKNGIIPWNFKTDMKHFSNMTKGNNIVIYGRKTFESLPKEHRPLRDRLNIVVSNSGTQYLDIHPEYKIYENLFFVNKIEDAISMSLKLYINKLYERVFVIGGSKLYDYSLNSVLFKKAHITFINKDYECDLHFNKDLLFNKCYHEMSLDKNFTDYDTYDLSNKVDINISVFIKKDNYKGEQAYLKLMYDLLVNGDRRNTRNSVTYSLFGNQLVFDLNDGFPMTTTRKTFIKSVFYELKMFLLGETDTKKWLENRNIKIWSGNTSRSFLDSMGLNNYEEGTMGNMYGYQWRHFGYDYLDSKTDYTNKGLDQLQEAIKLIKSDSSSRRILISSYDPLRVNSGVLYPCHSIILQFYVQDNKLSVHMYQRSMDTFLGCNFNIVSTSLLLLLLINVINSDPNYTNKLSAGKVIISIGDYHLYENHVDSVITQLGRNVLPYPKIKINKNTQNFEDFEWSDIEIIDYKSYDHIKADMIP